MSAQGPSSTQVRACVQGDLTRPNTIIVGPNDPCPAGASPRIWSVQGPQGPAGPVTPKALEGLTPPSGAPKLDANSLRKLGRRKAKRRSIRRRLVTIQKSLGPNAAPHKTLVASCPVSHSKASVGGIKLDPPPGPDANYAIFANHPVAASGWVVSAHRYYARGSPWKLTLSVICIRTVKVSP